MAESGSPRPTLFLSDLHLSPDRPAAVAAFHAFVDGPARAAAAVYILGDLFDWWIGDDQLREPFIAPIVKSMRTLADSGVPLFVARGNRDFMLGGAFEDASGATLLETLIRAPTSRIAAPTVSSFSSSKYASAVSIQSIPASIAAVSTSRAPDQP